MSGEARVYLVGAGPGDPGLMTARSLELIARADVILHDKLIPAEALDGARADAELIDVGKVGGGEQVPQEETLALLLSHAREGRVVVRLKGGDPFVFGRGGEEALALRAAGIPFEVVPGITAGVAAPAHRGRARARARGPGARVAAPRGRGSARGPRGGAGGGGSRRGGAGGGGRGGRALVGEGGWGGRRRLPDSEGEGSRSRVTFL